MVEFKFGILEYRPKLYLLLKMCNKKTHKWQTLILHSRYSSVNMDKLL